MYCSVGKIMFFRAAASVPYNEQWTEHVNVYNTPLKLFLASTVLWLMDFDAIMTIDVLYDN